MPRGAAGRGRIRTAGWRTMTQEPMSKEHDHVRAANALATIARRPKHPDDGRVRTSAIGPADPRHARGNRRMADWSRQADRVGAASLRRICLAPLRRRPSGGAGHVALRHAASAIPRFRLCVVANHGANSGNHGDARGRRRRAVCGELGGACAQRWRNHSRRRLDGPGARLDFPVLHDIKAQGGTEYFELPGHPAPTAPTW